MPERKNVFLSLSILLYMVSMFFVAIYGGYADSPDIYGFHVFAFGVIMPFTYPSFSLLIIFLIWLSNPILWLAWIYIKRPKRSYYLSLVSSLLSISFVFLELENKVLGPAYYLWALSSIILVIGSLSMLKIVKV